MLAIKAIIKDKIVLESGKVFFAEFMVLMILSLLLYGYNNKLSNTK
ncbi:hypothetical protein MNBD_GAMMA12-455 [hydrothermal vent metagenome]|uniref:Uncharacterized protein n=1 Tax=hydrothermal vent metagenome TaxID=652676 RepID=A0A3B0YRD8_9ZZZZ